MTLIGNASNANKSISVSCGVKVRLIWIEARGANGIQTQFDIFSSVRLVENVMLSGALAIPSHLIFYPLPPPADATNQLSLILRM
jgi:hypothetical protein